jgi:dethiobiotin synthetase/adenosylmethionine--8-amino-7-oxononanoate aminotransferase
MEPVCLGAGGMVFVDPLFQACLVEVVRASGDLFGGDKWEGQPYERELAALSSREKSEWQGLPIIYDEGRVLLMRELTTVFSGLNRLSYTCASTPLSHTPDISVYAKILTGGLLPMSATLASSSIFDAFLSDRKVDALLHGHSYTANPIGCSVALKAVEMIEQKEASGGWDEEKRSWGVGQGGTELVNEDQTRWSFWTPQFVDAVSRLEGVKGAMAMGTVFAVELEDPSSGKSGERVVVGS